MNNQQQCRSSRALRPYPKQGLEVSRRVLAGALLVAEEGEREEGRVGDGVEGSSL